MATIYFSNNADSGDGTLRDAMTNASDGDVIMPDPVAFADAGDITISLSSGLPLASVSIVGSAAQRIILDRQSGGYFFRITSSGTSLAFSYVDFVNGRRTSSNESPIYVATTGVSLSFENCRFYNNVGAYSGFLRGISSATGATLTFVNCVAWGNSHTNSTYSASVFTYQAAADPVIMLSGCTFDTDGEVPFLNSGSYTKTDCLFNGENDWQTDFDTVGFVDRSANDYRLAPGSSYLTGGSLTGTDILGHTRTGSIGAFDGSWIVASATVAVNTSVDWIDVSTSATLTLSGDDRILTVNRGIYSVGGTVASSSRGYLVIPSGSTADGLTLTNVVACYAGAGASNLAATTSAITWSATDSAISVVLEQLVSGSWQTVAITAGTSYSTTLAVGASVRLFDGVNFLTATVPDPGPGPTPTELTFHPWGVYEQTITVQAATASAMTAIVDDAATYSTKTGFILMSNYYNEGETPVLFARITNSQTGAAITPSDVSSIEYTAYKVTSGWATQTKTAVTGHSAVPIDSQALLASVVPPSTDPRWTADTVGYNFIFEPDSRTNLIFPTAGDYEIVVTIKFASANPLPIVYQISVN